MPTLSSFPTLNLEEIGNVVFDQGKYLAVREYYGYLINLHLVEDTFVEVWNFRDESRIEMIEILKREKK
jgi:hypothetical protein